jgi:hypothetical protein
VGGTGASVSGYRINLRPDPPLNQLSNKFCVQIVLNLKRP